MAHLEITPKNWHNYTSGGLELFRHLHNIHMISPFEASTASAVQESTMQYAEAIRHRMPNGIYNSDYKTKAAGRVAHCGQPKNT